MVIDIYIQEYLQYIAMVINVYSRIFLPAELKHTMKYYSELHWSETLHGGMQPIIKRDGKLQRECR